MVGPVPVGVNTFTFSAPPPEPQKIPHDDVLGVAAIILTASYKDQEFVRVGYYQNTEYDDPAMMEAVREGGGVKGDIQWNRLVRNLADKPRVTRFSIKWYVPHAFSPSPSFLCLARVSSSRRGALLVSWRAFYIASCAHFACTISCSSTKFWELRLPSVVLGRGLRNLALIRNPCVLFSFFFSNKFFSRAFFLLISQNCNKPCSLSCYMYPSRDVEEAQQQGPVFTAPQFGNAPPSSSSSFQQPQQQQFGAPQQQPFFENNNYAQPPPQSSSSFGFGGQAVQQQQGFGNVNGNGARQDEGQSSSMSVPPAGGMVLD